MIHVYLWWLLPSAALSAIAFRGTQQWSCRRYSISNRPSQDCSSQDLSALPALFTDVISLNLADNSFPVIDRFPKNYSNLHTLRLDKCGIKRISVQALSSLSNIRVLDLSRNQLTSLTFGYGNPAITTLNLAHNSLRYLPDLSGLRSLRIVDLSYNHILSVNPAHLPPNVESLRLTGNNITHLTQWPFLSKLQELDVSFNPLECACPLWEFVGWAESLALFQEESLPCQRPKSLRKSRADGPEMICGPEVFAAQHVDQTTLSVGDAHRMCCVVSSYPKPDLWWEHDQQNITWGITQRHLSDSGRIEFCIEIPSIAIRDLGVYRCYAQLEDLVVSKEFHVRRAREPLVLSSPPNIIFYCQFSIGLFIFAFCCATCCILRRGRPSKTGPEKDSQCRTTVVHVLPPKEDSSNSTTPSYCSQEHYHVPVGCCLEDCQYVPYEEDCYAPEYPFIEERRYLQATAQFDDTAQRRISQWRHRIAAMPAPLAQFDKETNIMGIVHTAV